MYFGINSLIFMIILLSLKPSCSSEVVPVFMWGTTKINHHVPALYKITEDSFKDILYDQKDSLLVVFAENTLSPEDFAQNDQNGLIPFKYLHKLRQDVRVVYKPHVQNPIGAVKQLDKQITEVSVDNFLKNFDVPKDNVLIIDLNDAEDEEERFDMLQRHDKLIQTIYNELTKIYKNVVAIYTGHHTSWVAPEELISNRKTRSILATENDVNAQDNRTVFTGDYILFYLNNIPIFQNDTEKIELTDLTAASSGNSTNPILTLTKDKFSLSFIFTSEASGYWFLSDIKVKNGENQGNLPAIDIYAPNRFSYHCGNMLFEDDKMSLSLPGFQVQMFGDKVEANNASFGDPYDCVGFTSIPIWSGLFVTAILLLIMTFGLTMMMDIKTMDRFDDAKGKTITINASE